MSKLTRKQANVLAAEFVKNADSWHPPEVTGPTTGEHRLTVKSNKALREEQRVTAEALEKIRRQAYEEGLKQGKEEGRRVVLEQQSANLKAMRLLIEAVRNETNNFSEEVYQQLLEVVIAMVRQIIRRELTTDPEQIMAVIREAISALPATTGHLTLKLHPDDAQVVREIYSLNEETEHTWRIFEDPNLTRGGCIIRTESSTVDMDLDTRIAELVSQVMGGERSDD